MARVEERRIKPGAEGAWFRTIGGISVWDSLANLQELIRDTMASALIEASGVDIVVDDAANTITIQAENTYLAEYIRDTMAGALAAGANVTIEVDDIANTVTISTTGGGGGGPGGLVFLGHIAGTMAVGSGIFRIYNDTGVDLNVIAIRGQVLSAPSGGNDVFDVNIDGVTMFTTQANRPKINDGTFFTGKITSMDVVLWPDGSYITADVDSVAPTPSQEFQFQITAGAV